MLVLALLIVTVVAKVINLKPLSYSLILIVTPFLMFNRGNNDYLAYTEAFFYPESHIAEPGYIFLIKIIKLCGGTSHEQVLLVLGIFFAITLYRFAKYTKSINLILSLYVIFPFVLDITQIRNTFMLLFVLNAVLEYYNKSKLKCYILLAVGSTFHFFGILYIFSFLLLDFKRKLKKGNNFYKFTALFGLANLVLMPFIINIGIRVIPIQNIVDSLIAYSSADIKIFSLLAWGGILLSDLIVFRFFIKHLNSSKRIKNKELIQTLYDLMFIGIIFLGFLLYLFEFNRFFRNLFIIKYLLVGFMLPNMHRDEKILIISYLVITSALFAFAYSQGAGGIDYNFVLLHNAFLNPD